MVKGLLALLVAYFIGGALSPLLVKMGTLDVPAFTLTLCRFLIAIIVLLPFVLKSKISFKLNKLLIGNSLLFFGNVVLFSIGIQLTTILMSQIIYALVPIFVAIYARLILKEQLTHEKLIGLVIALSGLSLLIYQSTTSQDELAFGTILGNGLVLAAVLSWSLYVVLSKKIAAKASPVSISFVNFLITAAILMVLSPIEIIGMNQSIEFTKNAVISILGLGVLSSALMIFLIQYGIKKTSAFTSSLFIYFSPFFATATAIPILHEKITLPLVIGGSLIILGVFYGTSYRLIAKRFAK